MNTRVSFVLALCIALLGSYVYAQFGAKPAELSNIQLSLDGLLAELR